MNEPVESRLQEALTLYETLAETVWHEKQPLVWAEAQVEGEVNGPYAAPKVLTRLAEQARQMAWRSPRRAWILAALAHKAAQQHDDASARADCALALGETSNLIGEWARGAELCQAAQTAFAQRGDALAVARCQLGLAEAQHQLNRNSEARALCEAAQETLRRHEDMAGQAACALLLASIHRMLGQYREAQHEARQARERFEAAGTTTDVARCDVELAYVLACQQQYDEALTLLAAADRIFSQAGAFIEAAWGYRVQAVVYLDRGDYHRALDILRQARDIYQSEHMQAALRNCERTMANAYRRLGRCDEALAIYFRLRQEFAEQRMNIDVANCDMNIALAYKEQNRYAEALTFFRRASEACLAAGLTLHAARCQSNLALIEELLGAYDVAIEEHQRARDIFAQAGLSVNVAHCEENMARVYITTHQFDQALALLNSAQEKFKAAGSPLLVATNQVHVAQVHQATGGYDQAREMLEQARATYVAEQMPGQEALCRLRLADLEGSLGHALQAEALYRQARHEFASRQWLVNVALCDLGLGEASLAQGRNDQAREWFDSALSVLDLDLPDWAWRAHYGLARCYHLRRECPAALEHYGAALAAIRRGRAGLYTAQGSSAFFAGRQHVYDEALTLALELGVAEQAIQIVEQSKAQAYLSLLYNPPHGLRPALQADDPLNALLTREQELHGRIEALQNTLISLGDTTEISLQQVSSQTALLDQLKEARQEHEQVIARLFRARPLWAPIAHALAFDTEAFRRVMTARWSGPWAALAFYLSRSQLTGLYLDAETAFGWTKELTAFEERVLRICTSSHEARRAEVYQRNVGGYHVSPGTGSAFLRQLYSLLIPTVAQERLLAGQLLVVAPHGILHTLPFHALQSSTGAYLAQQATVVHTPSLHILQLLLERGETRRTDSPSALAIGVTEFGQRAPRLSAAAVEARAVCQLFGQNSTLLLNEESTREAVMAMSQRGDLCQYSILHFATHTIFDEDAPLESRVLLNDGDLTALDLFELSLEADLVTLSSCEGARSEINAGDEMAGLAQALFHAGAGALVAGLWSVPDESARVLMTRFYQVLQAGQAPAQALRTAQLQMIASGYTPFHWAPFIYLGHPGCSSVEPAQNVGAGEAPGPRGD